VITLLHWCCYHYIVYLAVLFIPSTFAIAHLLPDTIMNVVGAVALLLQTTISIVRVPEPLVGAFY